MSSVEIRFRACVRDQEILNRLQLMQIFKVISLRRWCVIESQRLETRERKNALKPIRVTLAAALHSPRSTINSLLSAKGSFPFSFSSGAVVHSGFFFAR